MKNLRLLFCMLMGLLIGTVAGIVLTNVMHSQQKKRQTERTTEAVTEEATMMDAAENTQEIQTQTDAAATPADAYVSDDRQPEALTEILGRSLVSYSQLADVSCRQLIVVDADQEKASISMYVCGENGLWTDTGLTTEGCVGENGVSRESYEGSRMTPAGVFPIE